MLPPKKELITFLLRFAFLLTVCMIPWPRLGEAYGRTMGAIGNVLVGDGPVASVALLRFGPPRDAASSPPDSNTAYQTELSARNTRTGALVRVPIDLRTLTFVPTAVFVALAMASPIWKRARGPIVLVSGLIILQLFLLGSIAVPLLLFFSNPQPMQLFRLSSPVSHVLDVVYRSLVAPPGMAFAIPGLIWLTLMWLIPARPEHQRDTLANSETGRPHARKGQPEPQEPQRG